MAFFFYCGSTGQVLLTAGRGVPLLRVCGVRADHDARRGSRCTRANDTARDPNRAWHRARHIRDRGDQCARRGGRRCAGRNGRRRSPPPSRVDASPNGCLRFASARPLHRSACFSRCLLAEPNRVRDGWQRRPAAMAGIGASPPSRSRSCGTRGRRDRRGVVLVADVRGAIGFSSFTVLARLCDRECGGDHAETRSVAGPCIALAGLFGCELLGPSLPFAAVAEGLRCHCRGRRCTLAQRPPRGGDRTGGTCAARRTQRRAWLAMTDTSTAFDSPACWPALPLREWQDTCATLHMWTQIVGKIRLALTPLVNHWWNVPLYVYAARPHDPLDAVSAAAVRDAVRLRRARARARCRGRRAPSRCRSSPSRSRTSIAS